MHENTDDAAHDRKAHHVEDCLASVREALLQLRYGTIALTVHEDRVVQIDVTEKKRLRAT